MLVTRTCFSGILAWAALLVVTHAASAEYVSARVYVPLNRTNSPYDASPFGTVLFEIAHGDGSMNGLYGEQARITFSADQIPSYGDPVGRFGFDSVAFNTNLELTPGQISLPANWTLTPSAATPFGRFSWKASTTSAGDRSQSISLLISGLGDQAWVENFMRNSWVPPPLADEPPGDTAVFAGHIAGFAGTVLPHNSITGPNNSWLAVGNEFRVTPEPSSLVLGVVAICGFILSRRGLGTHFFAPHQISALKKNVNGV